MDGLLGVLAAAQRLQQPLALALGHACHRLIEQQDLGLHGQGGVRVNQAGCLDRCAGGPVMVVYPEAVWYTYVDKADIDEIIERHVQKGEIVERLLTPSDVGR